MYFHKANHPETDVIYGDISEAHTKQKIYQYANKTDILCGGPPCQGFSQAGKRIIDDPRNQLFLEFIESISVINPKVVVMENVKDF
jgi:DNA (cytosine-5)-methyltransferase 1